LADYDGLFESLDAAVSKTYPEEVRSEILQVIALQILNGDILEQQATKQLRSFGSKAYQRLGGNWGPVSIDAARDGLKLVDMIEDDRALAQFEELELTSRKWAAT
jgi:hypothetical protein